MSREATIRATHAALTLGTLEALASKGLLRRAQKDVERGEVTTVEMTDQGLAVTVSGHRVLLVESGPARASCTCPAPGVCQHVLAGCLRIMQDGTAAAGATPDGGQAAQDEWLALSDGDLVAAFGLPVLRVAHQWLQTYQAEIELGAALIVRFAGLNAEARGLPGVGVTGIIVTGSSGKRHAVVAASALLAVRQKAGRPWEPPIARGAADAPAPAHRREALTAACGLIEEMVATGLARLSATMIDRLDALAVSAQTAELPRLSLLLQRLATQGGDWLLRRPHADLSVLFADMSLCYALVHALMAKPQPHLAGASRAEYVEVGSLELTGVTGWPWRTASGYEGLTVLMWDQANAGWATWSEARPKSFQAGFSAVGRFAQPGPWEGAESPAQMVRSRIRLLKARRNRWGRLSSSAHCRALVLGAAKASEITASVIDDWGSLDDVLAQASPMGLRERDPRSAYQIVRPSVWQRQPFDQVSQSLVWILRDASNSPLELRLPFDDLAAPAIRRLEELSPAELEGGLLLGRCTRIEGRMQLFPLAVMRGEKVISLFFDRATLVQTKAPTKAAIEPAPTGDDDFDPVPREASAAMASPLSRLSLAAVSALEWLAEKGVRGGSREVRATLEDLSEQAMQFGSPALAGHLRTVAASQYPQDLLRLRWVLVLMQEAMQ